VAASTRLRLRVSPGAARAAVVGRHGEAWKVRVAAAPEAGRANEAVLRLVADALRLARDDIRLVAGHTSRDKVVAVAGIDPAETDRRLASATATAGKDTR